MKSQPLFIAATYLVLGILFQEYFFVDGKTALLLVIFGFVVRLLVFTKVHFLHRIKFIYLFLFYFSFGVGLHYIYNAPPHEINFGREETVIFQLQKKLNSNEKNRKYEVLAWNSEHSPKVKAIFIISKDEDELNFNHFYRAKVYLNKIEKAQHDYQFDYQKYLKRKGILYQMYAPDGFQRSTLRPLNFAEKYRQKRLDLLSNVDRSTLSKNTKDFLKGIILADRTEMSQEVISDFQKTGLAHILAISGAHIAILFGIFLTIFRFVFYGKNRKIALVISLIFIWLFAIFIGLGNSVFRACLMLSAYYIYHLLERKPDFLHAFSLAIFCILLTGTNQLFDVGFQLSFSAVLGIFWLNEPIKKFIFKNKSKSAFRFVQELIGVTLAAQIGTLPFVLFYFHQFSFTSLISNLLLLPLMSMIILCSLIMTIILGFNFGVPFLYSTYDFLIGKILSFIHWMSTFDLFFLDRIPFSFVEALILSMLIYQLRFVLTSRTNTKILRVFALFLILVGIRLGLNVYHANQNEILTHQMFKNKAVSVKNGQNITFFVKKGIDQKRFEKFIAQPYAISRRTRYYKIVELPENKGSMKISDQIYSVE